MAVAKIETVQVEKTITVEEEKFVLTLTSEEATLLRDIAWKVAGNPEKSRRGIYDGIDEALRRAGVKRSFGPPEDRAVDMPWDKGLYFKDRV